MAVLLLQTSDNKMPLPYVLSNGHIKQLTIYIKMQEADNFTMNLYFSIIMSLPQLLIFFLNR